MTAMGRIAGIAIVLLLASACATHPTQAPHSALSRPTADTIAQRLNAVYARWRGTPYRWGGNSKEGMDCSAFVQRVFKEGFGVDLPRSTREQGRVGSAVRMRWLQPGDLLFFRPGRGTQHVGIYMGDDQFIHASTSKGVTRGSLADRYWRRSLTGVRRIPLRR